jgi:hypothetical protein
MRKKDRLEVRLQAHVATATSVDLRGIGEKYRCATIAMFPDDVWLDIFDSCLINKYDYQPWKWVELVHVCRRWRQIIFASPRRLHLQLGCTRKMRTPFRKHLDFWPAFPIFINYNLWLDYPNIDDNVMAALEHPGWSKVKQGTSVSIERSL